MARRTAKKPNISAITDRNKEPVINVRPIGKEIGSTGLIQYSGYIYEEQVIELQGYRWYNVVRQMLTHPVIAAIFDMTEYLLRQADWPVVPRDRDNEDDVNAAIFIQQCLHEMQFTWQDTLAELARMMPWGWSVMEIIYSKRSDGTIGWAKWATRAQETLLRWQFDDIGNATEMIQLPPPDFRQRIIPLNKCLHFTTSKHKNNPEGQALTLDTLLPTPNGWTTIGDVKVGESVFDEQGKIRYVVAKSEVFKNRPCYEIEFSSGTKIVADENHQWSVSTFNDRSLKKSSRILTTRQIFEQLNRKVKNPSFSCGDAPVLDGTEMSLPVDPYILGYWLGDGSTVNGQIACDIKDFANLKLHAEAAGYNISHDGKRCASTTGLKAGLSIARVLGDKHIPQAYLRASVSQRLALLQGLMDSDGCAAIGKDKSSLFFNTNRDLIEQVAELIRSLGGRPHVRIHQCPGRSGGTINGHQIIARKFLYQIAFYLNLPCHRLPRKAARQSRKQSARVSGHFIKSIRSVENADTVCIEVDSPSHLFLAGEGMVPTHNSLLRKAYVDWYYATNLNRIESIGLERRLNGIPKIRIPAAIIQEGGQNFNTWKDTGNNLRRDEQACLIIPSDRDTHGQPLYDVELMGSTGGGGQQEGDTQAAIQRHETRIAQALLADFIMLGHDKVGSFALAQSKTDMFAISLGAFMDTICETINKTAVTKLLEMNSIKGRCELAHSDLEHVDLTALALMLDKFAANGIGLSPFEQQWIKKQMGFPQPDVQSDVIPDNGGTDEKISEAENQLIQNPDYVVYGKGQIPNHLQPQQQPQQPNQNQNQQQQQQQKPNGPQPQQPNPQAQQPKAAKPSATVVVRQKQQKQQKSKAASEAEKEYPTRRQYRTGYTEAEKFWRMLAPKELQSLWEQD